MSNWKTYKLGDLLEITSSKRIMRSDYLDNGIPFYRSKEIIELNNNNAISTEIFISKEKFNEIEKKFGVPQAGDMLLTSVGTLGIPYIVKDSDKFYFKDGNLTWFRKFSEKLSSKYLYYWFSSSIGKNKLNDITIGSTQQALTIAALKGLSIFLPNLDKQLEIVKALDSISDKIQLNTQINQTLEQMAAAIFKSWFIDFDPVRAKADAIAQGADHEQANIAAMTAISGKTVEELAALPSENYTELYTLADNFPSEFEMVDGVEVPKGWEVLQFKDFAKESKEKVGNLQGVEEYSVGNNGISLRSEKYKKQLSKNASKNKLLKKGNLVFGMSREILNWGIMKNGVGSVSSAYHIYDVSVINYLYLDMYIKNHITYFTDLIKAGSREGQGFDKSLLLDKYIYYPRRELLEMFLDRLNTLQRSIASYQAEIQNLQSIRDELLPKLLSGEI